MNDIELCINETPIIHNVITTSCYDDKVTKETWEAMGSAACVQSEVCVSEQSLVSKASFVETVAESRLSGSCSVDLFS